MMCTDHGQSVLSAAVLHEVEIRETVTLPPVDSVEIVSLMDNVTDAFMPDQGPARRVPPGTGPARPAATMAEGTVPDALVAEHGFSMLVTVRAGDREHRFLFDAGTSPDGMTGNMRRLGLDPGSIEAVVLSHGHFDHTAGLDGLIRVLGRANMPLVLHPDAWRKRRISLPGREPIEIPTPSRRALAEGGFEVLEMPRPSFLFGGSVLITGEVGRVTGYEPGFPPQQAWLDGQWRPDPLVLDDQAVVINVKDKGLLVLTGCGHAGIVNICRHARALTGGTEPLYAALGGFHLNGPLVEPLIPRVLDDLAALGPQVLVPAHCTGWRAQHAMARRFGEAFIPNSVGTRFSL
jgi:7,8-dihydropterin-6-yl-methyl-4-(beta-D-ribofuranosyl)aminobenzene 5'-phosphate synthase